MILRRLILRRLQNNLIISLHPVNLLLTSQTKEANVWHKEELCCHQMLLQMIW